MAPVKDYSIFSDEELGQKLVDLGFNIGPINVATRKTYERKLFKIETGQESQPTQQYEAIEEDDDDDEVQLQFSQQRHALPQPSVASHSEPAQPRLRRDYPDTLSSFTPRIEGRANLNASRKTTSEYTESRSFSRPVQRIATPPSSESKGIPLWVKLISILVIIVLIYLIYSNMEPQAVSSIPQVPHKVEV